MKERPIIFSTPMVLAIMDNRKKQTRRAMSPHYANTMPENIAYALENCPYGKPNDLLYVRESFFSHGKYIFTKQILTTLVLFICQMVANLRPVETFNPHAERIRPDLAEGSRCPG